MRIKTGFRVALTAWAVAMAVTALSVALSQQMLLQDTLQNERIEQVVDEGTQLVQLTYEVLFYGENRAVEQWRVQFGEVDRAVHEVDLSTDPDLRGTLNGLFRRFDQLRPLQERLIFLREKQPDSSAISILASQLFQDSLKLQSSLRELKTYSDDALRTAYQSSKERHLLIFGLFAGFVVIYGMVALGMFHLVILKPLDMLGRTIHALRDGAPVRAEVRRDDEIGAVCTVFNTLLDEQEASRKEVQAMAERFRNVFEQAAVGMSIISPKGVWLEVNQCLCEILGLTRDEILQLNYRDFTPAENIGSDIARVSALLAGERNHDSWESRHRRKNGEFIEVRVTTALARDRDGQPLYFVTVTEDITERKRAAEVIRQINRQLEEQARVLKRTNADLESFAWVASHDLREPLRMVTTFVGMIEKRLGPDINDDMRDFIGYAIDGAKRMDMLIRSLLEYARVGHKESSVEPVPLPGLLADSLRILGAAIDDAGASITIADDLPTVMGVRDDLLRLFQNLVANAIKYRDPDRRPQVAISARRQDDAWWVVTVADNGIGIEQQYYKRIFGIFQRLHTRERYEGTGIGLALCKKIVERMGGEIWLDSRPGDGTSFHFTLPAVQAGQIPSPEAARTAATAT